MTTVAPRPPASDRSLPCSRPPEELSVLRHRTLALLRTEIDFVPHPEFAQGSPDDAPFVEATLQRLDQSRGAPAGLPPHLQRMCESDLLNQAQETALFREMNYLKYRANVIRSRLDPEQIDEQAVADVDSLLQRATELRDYIVRANMRLVMAIVKKFVTPQQPFDELLSEGILTLMQAVEKFDFARGFRFSTYAYRSIARNAYRFVTNARREEARFLRDSELFGIEQEEERNNSSATSDQLWSRMRDLALSLLDRLDRREQFIIRSRYALGAHRRVRTFQELADKLGVSKERVRQLEQRAVGKLQQFALQHEREGMLPAAMI